MEQTKEIRVPIGFFHPLLFNRTESIKVDISKSLKLVLKENPFTFDLAQEVLTNPLLPKPWLMPEVIVPQLLELWQENQNSLLSLFKERNSKAAREPMIQSLCYFFNLLFWGNETHVSGFRNWQESVKQLQTKPINVVERLEFILLKPDNYHSFSQLSQLFDEMNKKFIVRQSLLKKKTSQK